MTENKENKVWKPTVFTPETLKKLEEAFAIGATDSEACFYADVSTSAFYEYQNRTEWYLERKNALKEKPILKARQEVVKWLDGNAEFALKYLERKRKSEFSLRQEIEARVEWEVTFKIEL